MAIAPQAIETLYGTVTVGGKQLGGIVGDAAHSFGYHLARNQLPGDDYSVVLPLDKQGASDCASALDISLGPAEMIMVTKRLLAAARNHDPRLRALREFCGTTDGQHTHPYDLSNGQDGPLDSWDDSHLWHVHLSFYRAYANNHDALAPIASVINGTAPEDELMSADVDKILAGIAENNRLLHIAINGRPEDPKTPGDQHVDGLVQLGKRLAALEAKGTTNEAS